MRDVFASLMFSNIILMWICHFSVQALTPNSEIIIMLVKDTRRSGPLCIWDASLVPDEPGRSPAS